jgi:hypothetical protein
MITERTVSKHPSTPLVGRAVTRRQLRVEECHRLDLVELRRDGVLDADKTGTVWRSETALGVAQWPSKVFYSPVVLDSGERWLVLADEPGTGAGDGTQSQGAGAPEPYPVRLTSTPCHLGGQRWWFRCPLVIEGVPCKRRCRVLYRPPGERYFGCRECYRLTYRVRQWHRDKWWEGFFRPMELLEEDFRRPVGKLKPRQLARRLRQYERAVEAMKRFPRLVGREAGQS